MQWIGAGGDSDSKIPLQVRAENAREEIKLFQRYFLGIYKLHLGLDIAHNKRDTK